MMVRSSTLSYILLPLICLVLAVHAQSSIQVITLQDGGATTAYVSQQTAGVMEEMSSTRALKELLSGTYTSTALTVDAATVNSLLHQHIHNFSFTIVEGCMPSSITLNNDLVIIDPLCIQESRTPSPKLIYLFPVLEQQLDMAALYCSRNGISPMATRVLLRNGTNIASITAAANSAFKRYGLGLPSSSVVVSGATISDELLTSGTTFVVGLTTADVAPLVTFLEAHSDATVIVDFDDLTVLYDTFVTSFGTEYKSAMSRLLYTTNLPRWNEATMPITSLTEADGVLVSAVPQSPASSAMALFHHHMPLAYHTPAGLRAFMTLLFVDAASSSGSDTAMELLGSMKHVGKHRVTSDHFGSFSVECDATTEGKVLCMSHTGITQLHVMSFGGLTPTTVAAIKVPVGVPGPDDGSDVKKNSWNVVLYVILAVIGLMILLLLLLLFFCLCWQKDDDDSDDEDEDEQQREATLIVALEQTEGGANGELDGVMQRIISQEGCTAARAGDNKWVVLTSSPLEGVKVGEALRVTLLEDTERPTRPIRIGIHTGPVAPSCAPPVGLSDKFAGCGEVMTTADAVASMCDDTQVLLTEETHGLLTPGECTTYGIAHYLTYRFSGRAMELYHLRGTNNPLGANEAPLMRSTEMVDPVYPDAPAADGAQPTTLPPALYSEETRLRGETESHVEMAPEPIRGSEEVPRRGPDGQVMVEVEPLHGTEVVAAASPVSEEERVNPLRSFEEVKPGGERTVVTAPIENDRPPTPLRSFEEVKPGGERTVVAAPIENNRPPTPLQSYEEVMPGGERRIIEAPLDERPPTPLRSFEEVKPGAERVVHAAPPSPPLQDEAPVTALHGVEVVAPRSVDAAAVDERHAETVEAAHEEPVEPLHSFEEVPPRHAHPTERRLPEIVHATNAETAAAAESERPATPLESWECVNSTIPSRRRVTYASAGAQTDEAMYVPPSTLQEQPSAVAAERRCVEPEEQAVVEERGQAEPEPEVAAADFAEHHEPEPEPEFVEEPAQREPEPEVVEEPVRQEAETAVEEAAATAEHHEPEPEPEVVEEPVQPEPEPEPEVVEEPVQPEPEPEPEVAEEPVQPEPEPEPEVVEEPVQPEPEPEPEVVEEPVQPEPEPEVVEEPVQPEPEPEPEVVEEPVQPEPEPEPEVVEEPVQPEPEPEPEVVEEPVQPEPEPEPEVVEEPVQPEPEPEPEVMDEPARQEPEPAVEEAAAIAEYHEPEPEPEVVEDPVRHEPEPEPEFMQEPRPEPQYMEEPVRHEPEPAVVPEDVPPEEAAQNSLVIEDPEPEEVEPPTLEQMPVREVHSTPCEEPLDQNREGSTRYSPPQPSHSPEQEVVQPTIQPEDARAAHYTPLREEPMRSPSPPVHFVHGQPTVTADKMLPCFEVENGLLFRITDTETGKWGFYNDTTEFIMHVRFSLGRKSRVVPLGSTVIREDPGTGRFEGEVLLNPGSTEMVFMGHVNGHRMRYYAIPLTREYQH